MNIMTSDIGKNLIKKWESCKLDAYMAPEQVKLFKETKKEQFTIGWGATYIPAGLTIKVNGNSVKFAQNTPITKNMKLDSIEEADKLFDAMLPIYEKPISRLVKVKLSQNQYDALVSFCYNLGEANFGSSSTLRFLNQGDYAMAAACMAKWDNIGKEESKGLENRRVEEIALFCQALNNI